MNVDGVEPDEGGGGLRVLVSSRHPAPDCGDCGVRRRLKDRSLVEYTDLASFGQPVVLVWAKRRWKGCCGTGSSVEVDDQIAHRGQVLTTRAGRWATSQVGEHRRSVASIAAELGCDWHTVNSTVIAYGEALLEADTGRVGPVNALGLDETLMGRFGPYKQRLWATSIVDVETGQLIDMCQGRDAVSVTTHLDGFDQGWLDAVTVGVMDLSGAYRKVFNDVLAHVVQVADPFHVIKNANARLDECRRRVQNEQLGHRGRSGDPLYGIRRLLSMASERLDPRASTKIKSRLRDGDPDGQVECAWIAKEAVRDVYNIDNRPDATIIVDQIVSITTSSNMPPEVKRLGRMLKRWAPQITNWHTHRVSNGPTEGANNLIKLAKRIGFGFRNFHNYRIRALLYAGQPNWHLLNTILPAQIR